MTDDENLWFQGDVYEQIGSVETEQLATGDINNDGYINILDIVLVLQHIIGNSQLTGVQLQKADFNQDGNVDVLDLVAMVQVIIDE